MQMADSFSLITHSVLHLIRITKAQRAIRIMLMFANIYTPDKQQQRLPNCYATRRSRIRNHTMQTITHLHGGVIEHFLPCIVELPLVLVAHELLLGKGDGLFSCRVDFYNTGVKVDFLLLA